MTRRRHKNHRQQCEHGNKKERPGCSDWSAGNSPNLYSFVASNVGDRAAEWRIINFQFVRQQPKPCRPYAEKVKSPDRVVIQDQGVSFMLLYLMLRFHCFDFVLRKSRNEVSEAEPEFESPWGFTFARVRVKIANRDQLLLPATS